MVNGSNSVLLPVIETRVGKVIGGEGFVSEAMKRFECRNNRESMERKRINI